MLDLRLLGSVRLTDAARAVPLRSQPKRLALLAYLACQRPEPASRRDTLLALFWPEKDAKHGRNALRQSLYQIRKLLGENVLLGKGEESVSLNPELIRCDVPRFQRAVEEDRLDEALELYGGELLPGLHLSGAREFERWLDAERERLQRTAREVARELARRAVDAGEVRAAIRYSWRATEIAPLDEATWRRHVTLLADAGDRAAAVRAYRSFARRLETTLGLEPSAITRELVQEIRTATDGGAADSDVPVPPPPAAAGRASAGPAADGKASAATELVTENSALPDHPQPFAGPGPRADDPASGTGLLGGFRGPLAGTLVVLAMAAVPLLLSGSPTGAGDVRRVAVLPLRPSSSAGELPGYLLDGLPEAVSAELSRLGIVDLVAPRAASRNRSPGESAEAVARTLDVDAVLHGTVRRSGSRIDLRMRLDDRLGRALWSGSFRRDAREVRELERDVAVEVAEVLRSSDTEPGLRTLPRPSPVEPAAYDLYLQASSYMARGLGGDDVLLAAGLFERAVQRDTSFAAAYAGLSKAHARIYFQGLDQTDDRARRARLAADHALALHPSLPEGQAAVGWYHYWVSRNYEMALRHFSTALELRPGTPDLILARGLVRRRLGRWEDALADLERARELDPRSAEIATEIGISHMYFGRYDAAADSFERAITLVPDQPRPYAQLAAARIALHGSPDPALEVLRRGAAVLGPRELLVRLLDNSTPMEIRFLLLRVDPEAFGSIEASELSAPAAAQYHLLMAETARQAGHETERTRHAERALAASRAALEKGGDRDFHVDRSRALALLGRPREALAAARKALELGRDDARTRPVLLWNLAYVEMLAGRPEDAAATLERMLAGPSQISRAVLQVDPRWGVLAEALGKTRVAARS